MESLSFEAIKKFVENLIVGARTVPATIIIVFTILFVGRDNLPTLIASQHYIVFLGILTTVIAALWRAELNGLSLSKMSDTVAKTHTLLTTQTNGIEELVGSVMQMLAHMQTALSATTNLSNHLRGKPTKAQIGLIVSAQTSLYAVNCINAVLMSIGVVVPTGASATSALLSSGAMLSPGTAAAATKIYLETALANMIDECYTSSRGLLDTGFRPAMTQIGEQTNVNILSIVGNTNIHMTEKIAQAVLCSSASAKQMLEIAGSHILITTLDTPFDEELEV